MNRKRSRQIAKMPLAVLLICIILAGNICTVFAHKLEADIPKPTAEFYVNDFADILSSSAERKLVSLGESISRQTDGGQVVFVSVASIGSYTLEEYANELFNQWGIGSKKGDKGILFILDMGQRESRIEVGYGYEGALTDIESYKLLEKLADISSTEGLETAVETIYKDICLVITEGKSAVDYPESSQHSEDDAEQFIQYVIEHPFVFVILLVLFILDLILFRGRVTFFLLRMMASGSRRGGGGGGRNSGGGGRSGGGGASSRF